MWTALRAPSSFAPTLQATEGQVPQALLPQCLHALALGVSDKSGEVRGAAAELVAGLLQVRGGGVCLQWRGCSSLRDKRGEVRGAAAKLLAGLLQVSGGGVACSGMRAVD